MPSQTYGTSRGMRIIARALTPETLIENDFSKGQVSDADIGALGPGHMRICNNWMPDIPGKLYKRGGFTYVGGNCGTANNRVHLAEFPALGKPELVVLNTDLNLYRFVSPDWTSAGAYGGSTGYQWAQTPVMVPDGTVATTGGKMIWGMAGGTDFPRVYQGNGAAPRAMAGIVSATQGGRYMAFYKSRLALAASTNFENRMWFSPDIVTGVESTWNVANAYIDFDYAIKGTAALQNVMLVFSRSHVERLIGSSPPPGGDMSHGTIAAGVGCMDAHSIVTYGDSAIWAHPSGVYMSNGTGVQDLTLEGGIKRDWQSATVYYDETTGSMRAGLFKNFYFVSVTNGGLGTTLWVLDIPRRVWWQLTMRVQTGFATAGTAGDNLYAVGDTNHVWNLAPIFTPNASNRTDGDGAAISAVVTGRNLDAGSPGLKHWRDGRVVYKLYDTGGNNPALVVNGTSLTTLSAAARQRESFPISAVSRFTNLTISESTACDYCEVYGFEIDYRSMDLQLGGAV